MSTPSTSGKRVAELRGVMKCSQQEFAELLRVSRSYLGNIEADHTPPSSAFLAKLARRVPSANTDWVLTGRGDMKLNPHSPAEFLRRFETGEPMHQPADFPALLGKEASSTGLVPIPLLDLRAAAGGGAVAEEFPEQRRIVEFSEVWLRTVLRVNPQRVQLYVTQGDSMAPDINPGDLLIVDTSAVEVRSDSTYVFEMDGGVFVKKLQRLPGDTLRVVSVNQQYESYSLIGKKQSTIQVIGRVAFHGKLM